jgi:beta-phosphoglucomutase family hydrolase
MPASKSLATIWDMDGVIVDTALYHFRSWQYAFKKKGVHFTEADFQSKFGQRNDAIIRATIGREIVPDEIEEIALEKEVYFRKDVKNHIKPLPGAVELITALKKEGFKLAIASSAPPENIQLLLGTLGIIDCFQQFVSGKEVTESKPSPQIYQMAAWKLRAEPRNCIVFEDAITGVAGAKRAGMFCIAVTTTNPRESLREADLVVDSLAELTVSSLESFVSGKQ